MNTQANKNQLKVSGGTTGQALVKVSSADYDYDWGDVSSSISIQNVNMFEDFTSCFTESDGAGVNNIPFLYANYFVGTSVGTFNTFSELDHPGVVEFSALPSSGEFLIYKLRNSAGGGIPLDNDFDVELLTKNVYNGDANTHRTTYSLNGGTTTPYVQVRGESGSNNITYNLFSTGGTTTIPASGTWFKPKFVYTSGTLELWIDGVLIDSEVGNFGVNEGGWISIDVFESGSGNITVSIDYSKLNYQVTR